MALALPSAVYWFGLHISLFFFLKSLYRIPPPFICHFFSLTLTHSSVHIHSPLLHPTLTLTHTHTSTCTHTHKHTERSIAQLHCKSMSLLPLLLCFVNCGYSTVTDLAKFLGKSTCKNRKPFVRTNYLWSGLWLCISWTLIYINGTQVEMHLDLSVVLDKVHSLYVN